MKLDDMKNLFHKHSKEHCRFNRVAMKLSNRADMHAFILLDKLVPGTMRMVAAAEHDEIYLGTDLAALAEVVTEEQVIDLIRCGVRYDVDGLCMFA